MSRTGPMPAAGAGATAPAPTAPRTGAAAPTTAPTIAPTGRPAPTAAHSAQAQAQARPASLPPLLRRLALAGSLVCVVNGAAAFAVVQTDAARVQRVVAAEQADLSHVQRVVSSMPQNARTLGKGKSEAYLRDVESVSGRLADATARAASGPAQFTGDVARLRDLSQAYTRYAALVENGRTTTGSTSAAAFADAEEVRTERIDPVLSQLVAQNAQRSDDAELTSTATLGFAGLTSLATLAVLLGGSSWLARRTKRVVNPGLVGALATSAGVSGYAYAHAMGHVAAVPGAGPLLLVGGITAAGFAWFGVDRRLQEYR